MPECSEPRGTSAGLALGGSNPWFRRVRACYRFVALRGWLLILAASLGLNVFLGLRVVKKISGQGGPYPIDVGAQIPPMTLKVLGKDAVQTVHYEGPSRGTVIYAFSPQCGWCWRNEPNVAALMQCANGPYRVFLVAMNDDGILNYFRDGLPPRPILLDDRHEFLRAAKITTTPTTLVVSTDGKVAKVWAGAYIGKRAQEISEYFHCLLPGLRESPEAPHERSH